MEDILVQQSSVNLALYREKIIDNCTVYKIKIGQKTVFKAFLWKRYSRGERGIRVAMYAPNPAFSAGVFYYTVSPEGLVQLFKDYGFDTSTLVEELPKKGWRL